MKGAAEVLGFALDRAAAGERTAIVTIVGIEGGSSRDTGTQIAVSETGSYRGSLSGGCVEAAVVGEARRVIGNGRAEIVRFGAGSRFIDVRLPCGGTIDLLITPDPPASGLRHALEAIGDRRAVAMVLDPAGGVVSAAAEDHDATGWRDGRFVVRHDPDLRVVIVGQGAETRSLAGLARC